MSTIRPAELDERLDSGSTEDLLVVDIRPTSAYRAGSIDGSRNVPVYEDLRSGDDSTLRGRLDEIPADKDVVVVCKQGMVAKRATSILREEGYDAMTLLGGMGGWNGYQKGSLGYKLRSLIWKLS
ncbi:rhodanese-like domain-containing protein [Halobellus inordinatus]|uniref:rhodanese-like domain-containing protein n=1 Tax=Halobellus inordinatus TaxID=1126236 RepID=UPI00210CC203|nr:rhodanese-like domain-containing protein [Halobellus inordinatus]